MLERVPPPRADKGRLFVGRRARGGGSTAVVRLNGHGRGFTRHVAYDDRLFSPTLFIAFDGGGIVLKNLNSGDGKRD